MNQVLLSDVCEINPRMVSSISDDAECSFIPMEYVDDISGTIAQTDIRRVGDVKKGYTFFRNDDVIFAKITPCMENGKCAIGKNLLNGIAFGSTEFHVVRAKHQVIPEWIYYFLRQEKIRQQATHWFRGTAGQQRVPATFLEELKIPLPPLTEQKRIAALLARADRLRSLRRHARHLADSLLQSVFLEMFGEPRSNPKKFDLFELGEIVQINPSGRPKANPEQLTSFLPMYLVDPSHIFTDELDVKRFEEVATGYTYFEENDILFAKITPCMENGNIVIARNLLNGFGFGSTEFHVIRPNKKANAAWLYGFVKRPEFREEATRWFRGTAGQQRVPKEFLESYRVPLPPLPLQEEFARVAARVEGLRARQAEAERQAEGLFQSLLAESFA